MADFSTHLVTSSVLGVAYGTAGALGGHFDWSHAALAGGLTTLGGMLPDLDSASGIPARELFGLAAAAAPLLLLQRLLAMDLSIEQILLLCGGLYLVIRYIGSALFRRLTVHRGMFHSLPAMFLVGLGVYHLFGHSTVSVRHYLAGGVMVGFLSHLVLDELYAVDFMGSAVRHHKHAGSALKLFSSSWPANATTYGLLAFAGHGYVQSPAPVPPPPPLPSASRTPSPWSTSMPIPTAPKAEPPVHQVIRPGSR